MSWVTVPLQFDVVPRHYHAARNFNVLFWPVLVVGGVLPRCTEVKGMLFYCFKY